LFNQEHRLSTSFFHFLLSLVSTRSSSFSQLLSMCFPASCISLTGTRRRWKQSYFDGPEWRVCAVCAGYIWDISQCLDLLIFFYFLRKHLLFSNHSLPNHCAYINVT
jgi:hypothetical protein